MFVGYRGLFLGSIRFLCILWFFVYGGMKFGFLGVFLVEVVVFCLCVGSFFVIVRVVACFGEE